MGRRFGMVLSTGGLIATVMLWATAALISLTRPDGNSCVTGGYAHGDSWLLGAVIYPDGFVLLQYFDQNLSRHSSFYCKLSRMNVSHQVTFRSLFPRIVRPRVTSEMTFHLATPALFLAAGTFHFVALPILRRRRRRRLGLCLACGYDMRGASSETCTECGYVNNHLECVPHRCVTRTEN